MRPAVWRPPADLSPAAAAVVRGIRRGQLFVFLRRGRHELGDAAFQAELAARYGGGAKGRPPVPPALLALATLLQAYTGASAAEAVEAAAMDRRWQLGLDCLGADRAPFGKGTLVRFRAALVRRGLDRRLVERTVDLAEGRGGAGPRALRAALDAGPLGGAGRVEDTYNLLGHALRKALGVLARQPGRGLAAVAAAAGAPLAGGPRSLKAALDLDWDDPAARARALGRVLREVRALGRVLREVRAVERWPRARPGGGPPAARAALAVAYQGRAQDVEGAPARPALRRGVARARRISVEDGAMRHGRKSRSQRVDGFKRHVLRDLDSGLVRAGGLTPANGPAAAAAAAVVADLAPQGVTLRELHLDRGYLGSRLVRERPPDLTICCEAWPVRNGDRFPKTAFTLDWTRGTVRCPNGVVRPFAPGAVVRFPAEACAACPLRARCTRSERGRSVAVHPDERLLEELRQRQRTPDGRAKLRERAAVEHALAHVGRRQGRRARDRGLRLNLFDLRRAAAVENLHLAQRLPAPLAA